MADGHASSSGKKTMADWLEYPLEDDQPPHQGPSSSTATAASSSADPHTPLLIEYDKIFKATDEFHKENVKGIGGSATVYKCFLNGNKVAVKRFNRVSRHTEARRNKVKRLYDEEKEFLQEGAGENVIPLIGYCIQEPDELLLVFPFMDGGSLGDLLRGDISKFDWVNRVKIAIGLARGLARLHQLDTPIWHLDIKPDNILLDGEYVAYISDFGSAKHKPNEGEEEYWPGLTPGTAGYLAPERIAGRSETPKPTTEKADIYNVGLVLVQLLTHSKSVATDEFAEIREKVTKGSAELNIFNKNIPGSLSTLHKEILLALAVHCLSSAPEGRPAASKIVGTLLKLEPN